MRLFTSLLAFLVPALAFAGSPVIFNSACVSGIYAIPTHACLSTSGSGPANTDDLPEGSSNLYFTQARVRSTPITGYSSGAGTVGASDTVLQALNKLNGNDAQKVSKVAASTVTVSGALSAPATKWSGAPITGGDATTTKPLVLLEDAAASTGWPTVGTYLGINAATGFTGHLIDAQLEGVSPFWVDYQGGVKFTNLNDAILGSPIICGQGGTTGNNGCNALYTSPGGTLSIYNPNQGVVSASFAGASGRVTIGAFPFGHPDATLGVGNQAGAVGVLSFGVRTVADQTAPAIAVIDPVDESFFPFEVHADGSPQVNTTASKPSCDSTLRGTLWTVEGGAGVADKFQVCAKDAADAYAWHDLF